MQKWTGCKKMRKHAEKLLPERTKARLLAKPILEGELAVLKLAEEFEFCNELNFYVVLHQKKIPLIKRYLLGEIERNTHATFSHPA